MEQTSNNESKDERDKMINKGGEEINRPQFRVKERGLLCGVAFNNSYKHGLFYQLAVQAGVDGSAERRQ